MQSHTIVTLVHINVCFFLFCIVSSYTTPNLASKWLGISIHSLTIDKFYNNEVFDNVQGCVVLKLSSKLNSALPTGTFSNLRGFQGRRRIYYNIIMGLTTQG